MIFDKFVRNLQFKVRSSFVNSFANVKIFINISNLKDYIFIITEFSFINNLTKYVYRSEFSNTHTWECSTA